MRDGEDEVMMMMIYDDDDEGTVQLVVYI